MDKPTPALPELTNRQIAKMHRRILFVESFAKLEAMLETFHDEPTQFDEAETIIVNFKAELDKLVY